MPFPALLRSHQTGGRGPTLTLQHKTSQPKQRCCFSASAHPSVWQTRIHYGQLLPSVPWCFLNRAGFGAYQPCRGKGIHTRYLCASWDQDLLVAGNVWVPEDSPCPKELILQSLNILILLTYLLGNWCYVLSLSRACGSLEQLRKFHNLQPTNNHHLYLPWLPRFRTLQEAARKPKECISLERRGGCKGKKLLERAR